MRAVIQRVSEASVKIRTGAGPAQVKGRIGIGLMVLLGVCSEDTAEDVEWLGWRANYLNYYAGNDVVIIPVYGDVMDAEALKILGGLYPDKEIIPVNGEILAVIGGGIHCVTQQQPAR